MVYSLKKRNYFIFIGSTESRTEHPESIMSSPLCINRNNATQHQHAGAEVTGGDECLFPFTSTSSIRIGTDPCRYAIALVLAIHP